MDAYIKNLLDGLIIKLLLKENLIVEKLEH